MKFTETEVRKIRQYRLDHPEASVAEIAEAFETTNPTIQDVLMGTGAYRPGNKSYRSTILDRDPLELRAEMADLNAYPEDRWARELRSDQFELLLRIRTLVRYRCGTSPLPEDNPNSTDQYTYVCGQLHYKFLMTTRAIARLLGIPFSSANYYVGCSRQQTYLADTSVSGPLVIARPPKPKRDPQLERFHRKHGGTPATNNRTLSDTELQMIREAFTAGEDPRIVAGKLGISVRTVADTAAGF